MSTPFCFKALSYVHNSCTFGTRPFHFQCNMADRNRLGPLQTLSCSKHHTDTNTHAQDSKYREQWPKQTPVRCFPLYLDRWNRFLWGEVSGSHGLLRHVCLLLVSETLLVDCQRLFPLLKVGPEAGQTLSARQQSDE